jgi:phosphate transport system substrate-binding protein
MKGKQIVILLILGISLMSFSWTNAHAKKLEIWGSTTCQKSFLEPGAKALKKSTGIELKVIGVGTGQGLLALIQGKTKVSASSESLTDAVESAMKAAEKSNEEVKIPANLIFHEVKKDRIIPIINKSNPISSLTWKQMKNIHTGKITNWKELGGPDLPIRVVTSHTGSATRAMFQKFVMDGEPYLPEAVAVHSTRYGILEVSENEGAIGAVSFSFLMLHQGNTKPVKTDPISRPLGLITIGSPETEIQKVIDFYVSSRGNSFIY